VAIARRIDQESRNRAVRLLLRRNGGELDDDVGFLHDLLEQRRRVVVVGRIAFEQLLAGQHDLVGRLAAAAATAHAVGHHTEQATRNARVADQGNLVLLVLPVTLVDAGGSGESVAFAHTELVGTTASGRALGKTPLNAYYQANREGGRERGR